MSSAEEQRRPRPLLAAAVAAATTLSFAAYLAFSHELRFELSQASYKHTLLAQFLAERGLGAVRLLRPVEWRGVLLLLLFVLCCVAAGLALRRALGGGRGQRRGGAELVALSLGAAVAPSLFLATLFWPDGRGQLGSAELLAATVALTIVAGGVAWRRRGVVSTSATSTITASTNDRDPARGWAIVFLALLLPLFLAVWWNGLDAIRGFDSLADHLPRAARWLRLSTLTDESGELLTPYYPGDFQLLVRWMLVLGTDAYAFVPSLLATLLCLAALYGICRELGQPRWTALVSVATAATCTLLPYLSTTVEADTATTAFLLLAVLFLLRWLRTLRPPTKGELTPSWDVATLAALGVSLGLAVGTKYSALPPALVIVVVAAFHAWRASLGTFPQGRRYFNARPFVMMLATIVLPAVACAGYWMLRNAIVHGNPLYPIATAGLPGVEMRYIIPIKPALVDSFWARATYPWVQWDFVSVYDDGLGAPFAAVALVAFAVAPFLPSPRDSRRGTVWAIILAAYVLWIGTGSITARFGLFPLLLTFVMVGELWRHAGSLALRLVTLAAVATTAIVTTRSLLVGAVYTTLMPPARRGVPAVIDTLPPARIFNATSASNRYPLLGGDYRHEVITLFARARPEDVAATRPAYVLLNAAQLPAFTARTPMTLVARGPALPSGDTLSLWRVNAEPAPH
jgi:hypothetical protein